MIAVTRQVLYDIPSPALYLEVNQDSEYGVLKIKQKTLENENSWYYSYFVDIYPNNICNITKLLNGDEEFSLCSREMHKDNKFNTNNKFIILQKNDIQIMINNLYMLSSVIDY